MTAPAANVKRLRPRRIAADEAHAWARNLRLHNSLAKLVLSMLTLYVDGDGACFVGIPALAEDTELSANTVRSRLAWLENIGAVARIATWVDEAGCRNHEGRGRRTTDVIRLQMSAETDEIERRALGAVSESSDDEKTAHSPGSVKADPPRPGGSDGGGDSADPALGLRRPSDSVEGLDSSNHEPEPESPPTPSGGVGQRSGELQSEAGPWPHAASWAKAEAAWGDPILHQDTCRNLWSAFTEPERERFIRVIRGYLAWRLKQPKPPNRCNIQKLLRERDAWAGFEKLAGPDPTLKVFVVEGSLEHRALQVTLQIGGWSPPAIKFYEDQGQRGFWLKSGPPRADELAMAQFADTPIEQWTTLERGTKPFYAWNDRLFQWFNMRSETIRVPLLYPPRKDGSVGDDKELQDTG